MIRGNIFVSSMRNWNYNMCIIGYLRAIETLQGIGESDSGARDQASISHTDIYLSIEAKIPQCIVIGIPRNLIMRGIHACVHAWSPGIDTCIWMVLRGANALSSGQLCLYVYVYAYVYVYV